MQRGTLISSISRQTSRWNFSSIYSIINVVKSLLIIRSCSQCIIESWNHRTVSAQITKTFVVEPYPSLHCPTVALFRHTFRSRTTYPLGKDDICKSMQLHTRHHPYVPLIMHVHICLHTYLSNIACWHWLYRTQSPQSSVRGTCSNTLLQSPSPPSLATGCGASCTGTRPPCHHGNTAMRCVQLYTSHTE